MHVFSRLGTGPRPGSHFFCPNLVWAFSLTENKSRCILWFESCVLKTKWLISLPNRLKSKAWFCERCGAPLVSKAVEGTDRPCCPACGFVAYLDPKVAAGVIVTLADGVVLLKRNIEPGFGKWVFPGGYVDAGEPPEVAAVREAREEAGLEVAVEDLLGVFSIEGERVVLIAYAGRVMGGMLAGNFESQAVATFAPEDIPWDDLAFHTTKAALKIWARRHGAMP